MRRELLLCAVLLLTSLQACEPPRRVAATGVNPGVTSDNLAVVIADIQSAEARAREGDASGIRSLPHNIDVLTRAIEGGTVEGDALLTLRHYRAFARQMLNRFNDLMDLPVDRPVAEAAVADYLAIAEAAGDDPAKQKLKAHAIYGAGQVTATQLGNEVQGYRYFRQCSDMKQAGCQNVVAYAMIYGHAGIEQDLNGALALHKAVYDTGITYTCAGSFSARSIAYIVHFTDARLDGRTGLDWLRRSMTLADQVKSQANGVDLCAGESVRVDEYLMRLQAGERQDSLISGYLEENEVLPPVVAQYLLGKIGDATFTKELRKMDRPSARCAYAFIGAWKSSIERKAASVRTYSSMLKELPDETSCASNIVFVERFAR
ncbi:hypothetical protein [Parvibaculum sp.]|jgi:hypothetical protein|uniref:hypothetical protein n=1 Tax=Parvibaculum sp. TaxID=2024848 RepID=UPI001B16F576|nr:hypothetical protein [Parvibaculum sp.]MBO6634146.1 hypothetical protein [Parvibaculum sp.]MBO6679523.1 hypothetical protein [Parvibaculum sp.]MBO6686127.1 hypothetical protein [Parvibaculum sp.]MBO6904259.1 hypothetical protein [Parvibaculum sp.]